MKKPMLCTLGLHRWTRFQSNPRLFRIVSKEDSLTYMARWCRRFGCDAVDLD